MRNQYHHKARRVYDVEYIMFRCDTPQNSARRRW